MPCFAETVGVVGQNLTAPLRDLPILVRRTLGVAGFAAMALIVAGLATACMHPIAGEAVRSASPGPESGPTSSASVPYTLPAPHPRADEHSDGTPFEPCTAFSAEELQSWGVDPGKVDDVSIEMQNLIRGCSWWQTNRSWSLTITVLNASVDRYLRPDGLLKLQEPITIGGLSGAVNSTSGRQIHCDIFLPSRKAVVIFTVRVDSGREGALLVPDACNKTVDVATAVAGRLPQ